MMNAHVHGTVICVPCQGGFIIGNDSRLISSYRLNGENCVDIVTDEEVKLFQLCCEPNIYCTLMGDVHEWHKMFKHLLEKAPKSMEEAFEVASKYLEKYRADNLNLNQIGTTIVAYKEEEGFECRSLVVSPIRLTVQFNKSVYATGSGSDIAKKVLMERNDYPTMTRQEAVTMTLRALKEACFADISTGTNLKVTFVHSNGCISDTYQLLEVYSALYKSNAEEAATLFLVHSTSLGCILGHDAIDSLVGDLWSDAKVKNVKKHNMIGKKACFHIIRIVLHSETDAETVYEHLRNKSNKSVFPKALTHLSNHLIDCIRERHLDHIYVGRSSRELVEGLEKLEDADHYNY